MKHIALFNFRGIKHPDAGGSERSSAIMSKIMVERGYKVTLFCSSFKGAPSEEFIDGVRYVMRGNLYTVYVYAFFYYLFKLRKEVDYVIEDVNGIPWFLPLYCFKKKLVLIHHIHSNVFFKELVFPLACVAYLLEKSMALFYRSVPVVTVAPHVKRELVEFGFPEKNISITYNGIDNGFYSGKKTKEPLVVAVGRIKKYKRLDVLVELFEKVLKEVPEAKLKIVGAGDDLDNVKELIKERKLGESIICTGYVSDNEKKKILSEAWVYTIVSSQEGWGIGCIEANASGVPVVAYGVGGLNDSVKDSETGFLVDYDNEIMFVEKVVLLLKDSKLREKMAKNSIKYSKNFTWEKWTDVFLRVFGEL